MIKKIRKRDGRIVDFEQEKITNAIFKAFLATKSGDGAKAKELSDGVVKVLEERAVGIPGVEEVQDIVEEVLIKRGFAGVAKAYILYRQKRTEIREAKKFFGVRDELKLGVNATRVLERRYLLKDDEGRVVETPDQMFRRVAKAIARFEKDPIAREEEFYGLMRNLEFLPNTPTLMNAGAPLGQLSACFVIPVEDSLVSIFDAVRSMAIIQQSGGGTGFSFSKLRPNGDMVKSTRGVASGPVSFMRVFDTTTDVIKQGGKRRGANMGILRADHPDIIDFITSKTKEGFLTNFNISVAVDDAFMEAVEKDLEYDLINPRSGEAVKKLKARDIWSLIITMAWRTGDPGVVFLDEINRHNPTPHIGKMESTNPCAEQPLLPYESCNLGSINLSKMVKEESHVNSKELTGVATESQQSRGGCSIPRNRARTDLIRKNRVRTNGVREYGVRENQGFSLDWEKLRKTVRTSISFLDDVIDVNRFPLPEIERITKANRKIGLGVMGFADMLLQLGIPYDSEEALELGEKIMKFISEEARKRSVELGKERGSFPNFKGSIWEEYSHMRNATTTTVAPTGTLSIIAGCSSGIEPIFAISFVRNVLEGTKLLEVNPYFEKVAREMGFYSEELVMKIAKTGSVQGMEGVPPDVQRVFVTALDIASEWHVRMQAAFQKYTDNAVSKTINFPPDITIKEVEKAYNLAYKLGCKGITVYRYGSKKEQVLYIGGLLRGEIEMRYVSADSEFSGGCPAPYCPTS